MARPRALLAGSHLLASLRSVLADPENPHFLIYSPVRGFTRFCEANVAEAQQILARLPDLARAARESSAAREGRRAARGVVNRA